MYYGSTNNLMLENKVGPEPSYKLYTSYSLLFSDGQLQLLI
jgi:hypothetical protein